MTAAPLDGEAADHWSGRAARPCPVVNLLPGIRKTGGELTGLALPAARTSIEREPRRRRTPRSAASRPRTPCRCPTRTCSAFPLHMAIMTDPAFPFPAIGTRAPGELDHRAPRRSRSARRVDVTAQRREPARRTRRARSSTSSPRCTADGETVWEATSTYLRRGKGDDAAPTAAARSFDAGPDRRCVWRLPGDLGRRYAAVSGDHNPIHLYPLTAKALGFPRQIAHGMWTKARCVAALENRLPDAVRVEVAFKKPIFLPGTVAFGSAPVDGGFAFSLTSPTNGAPHLAGRTTAL